MYRRRGPWALLIALQLVTTPVAAEVVNRVILRVNDRITTLYDYQQRKADRLRAIRSQAGLDPERRERLVAETPNVVMKEILDELLILSRADQLGIVPSELDVEDSLARMKEQFGIENDAQFRAVLAQQGMTEGELRDQIARQQVWQEVVGREIVPRIEVGDDELRRYYEDHPEEFSVPEQIQVQEIVVLESESPVTQKTQDLAAEIRQRLAAGESMESLTEGYGERISSVIDVGWVSPGDLAPPLETALWPLQVGELSAPIEARGGLHVARILGRREATAVPFSEVKEQIFGIERQRRFADEAEEYLKEFEERSLILGRVPEEAADFRTATGRSLFGEQVDPFASPAKETVDEESPGSSSDEQP